MKIKETWILVLLTFGTSLVFGQSADNLVLTINKLSSTNKTLLFQLENRGNAPFFVAPFNTFENRVEIYSPKGDKISYAFIVCGDASSIYKEIAPGQSKVWNYNIVDDFFESIFKQRKLNRLEAGIYKIRWLVGMEVQEYSYYYEQN